MNAIRLYRHPLSGHAHRAELFLSILRLPFERIDVDLAARAHKSTEFLRKNPLGQVPVIEDGDVTIADSNAILVYLAARYDESGQWYPRDPVAAAQVQRWLAIAAGQLASGPAAARIAKVFGANIDYERATQITAHLFDVMDRHLADNDYFAGPSATIADVALYSYTAHAPEGGIDLGAYGHIRSWLARIEALDGFVPMKRTPLAA